ncbi:ankyrin repeat-containing domain protein [Tribonema minus]|uniref:Ankyrin repeat-containing domain protein n=1 Tax=Tribonema minus TaxID=303371 RepID=A0A836CKL3_9STRA|nr:ankyrin repeat-containing domain protein [Tribonema minus]
MSRRRSSVLDMMKEKRRSADASRVAAVDSDPWRLASFGMVDLLKVQMEKKGAQVDQVDQRGMTPLLWGEFDADNMVDAVCRVWSRMTPPLRSGSHEAVVSLLLERGASVDGGSVDEMGNGALHYAAARGVVNVIAKLLDKGADPGLANCQGTTPLIRAAAFAQSAAIKKLVAAGADVNKADKEGNTVLHVASRGGHGSVVKLLLHLKANPR